MFFSEHDIYQFFNGLSDYPWVLAVAIFFTTFLLEDLATSAAALLASQGILPLEWAVSSLMAGIILGDIGLYGLGHWAQKSAWLKEKCEARAILRTKNFIEKNYVGAILMARFIPGMRLPSYTSMGFFGFNFKVFMITVIFAVGCWSAVLFTIFYQLGDAAHKYLGQAQWLGFFGVLIIAFLLPHLIAKYCNRITKQDN